MRWNCSSVISKRRIDALRDGAESCPILHSLPQWGKVIVSTTLGIF